MAWNRAEMAFLERILHAPAEPRCPSVPQPFFIRPPECRPFCAALLVSFGIINP